MNRPRPDRRDINRRGGDQGGAGDGSVRDRRRTPSVSTRDRPSLDGFEHPRRRDHGGQVQRRGNERANVANINQSSSRTTNTTNVTHNTHTTHTAYNTHNSFNTFNVGGGHWRHRLHRRSLFEPWHPYHHGPAFHSGSFFSIKFGHPGFSLRFSKFGGYTSWRWWYASYYTTPHYFDYYCPSWSWRFRTWCPKTVFYTWYPPRYTFVNYVYTAPRPQVTYIEVPRDPCAASFGEAWRMIADRDGAAALTAFACLAQEYPYDGLANIGYAVANAMVGADESAVIAMRRAMAVDAESIRFVPADDDLDGVLMSFAQHFGERAKAPEWRLNGLFMMASLRAALGDVAGAHFTITEAIRSGDDDPSAHELRDTLAELLHKELYGS